MVDAAARELVRLARNLLFTRDDAYVHLPKSKAAFEVAAVERAFWEKVEATKGCRLDEDELEAALAAGGLSEDQARRWSRAIVRDEDVAGIELDPPDCCAHCGSAMRGRTACGVCAQPRGSVPSAPDDGGVSQRNAKRAELLVRQLVASNRLELVSARSEQAVVAQTVELLNDHDERALSAVAQVLEAAWMARADVAELFADTDEILAALQEK